MIAAMARHGKNPGNTKATHKTNTTRANKQKHENRQEPTRNGNRKNQASNLEIISGSENS